MLTPSQLGPSCGLSPTSFTNESLRRILRLRTLSIIPIAIISMLAAGTTTAVATRRTNHDKHGPILSGSWHRPRHPALFCDGYHRRTVGEPLGNHQGSGRVVGLDHDAHRGLGAGLFPAHAC